MIEENAQNQTANQKTALKIRNILGLKGRIWMHLEQPQFGLKQMKNLNAFWASALEIKMPVTNKKIF